MTCDWCYDWDDDDKKAAAFFAAAGRNWDAGTPYKSRRSDKHATETEGTSMTECDCVQWYEVFGQYEEFSK